MYIPFIGRLSVSEWPVVLFSFLVTYLEFIVSVLINLVPTSLIDLCNDILNRFFLMLSTGFTGQQPSSAKEDAELIYRRDALRNAKTIQEMGQLFGYEINDHIVETKDGYLLCLHRLPPTSPSAPVVYLHHGLLMCSDIWCTGLEADKNLPFVLHDLGYDVWLGNNRSNKYSTKHLTLKPYEQKFWDFSIDEFAIYDIPDSINYVLNYTSKDDLTYIGFSQGSAQAFAALSINPELNDQVKLFIAIAPAMTPKGLQHRMVDTLMKISPSLMYLLFGKRNLLPSASFWESILYPPIFVRIIDGCNKLLFNWRSENINFNQKIASFAHLYSTTSVKSVVHWFQIIRNSSFQMFDENLSITNSISNFFKVPNFPTRTNIKVPVLLIYGTTDSLVDINEMTQLLPDDRVATVPIENHEHLDMIWGDRVRELVFPHVLNALKEPERYSVSNDVEKVTSF